MLTNIHKSRQDGKAHFASGRFEEAAAAFTTALKSVLPTRNDSLKSILFSNRAAARMAQRRCGAPLPPMFLLLAESATQHLCTDTLCFSLVR
jgi:hypothetical protein